MRKILIVDDEEMILTLLKKTLERNCYEVNTAINGAEAIELFEQNQYDLVITDILMPEKEGIETIIAMRGLDPTIPLIAMSGGGRDANFNYLDMAHHFGVQASLRKPFKPDRMLELVRVTLAEQTGEL